MERRAGMNTKTLSNADARSVAGIENALDALLTCATDHRPPSREDEGPRSFASIVENIITTSRVRREAEEIVHNPLGQAARNAIRTLGEFAHEIGGQQLMGDVLARVAQRDQRRESIREHIMDVLWDGVGQGDGRPGWCA